jgi:predicted phage terminase large subunit-like protein
VLTIPGLPATTDWLALANSLSDDDLAELQEHLEALTTEQKISLTDFKAAMWRGYEHARHQAAIDAHLAQVADYVLSGGECGIKRLMIFIPPRHGKTQTVSRYFPAWLLGQNPDVRLIMASYGAVLAKRNSRFVRNLIDTPDYQAMFPGLALAAGSSAVDSWDIHGRHGGVIAAGVGGGITGHGANLVIIDDVVKSRAEAESETFRDRTSAWYTDDLLTRVEEPGGAIILMMTRWHTGDLAGWLLEHEPGDWTVLSLPALAEANDALGRQPGEALWPSRYNADVLNDRRERMGSYSFAALYQQSPMPSGGGLFDAAKIKVYEVPPVCTRAVRFYDLAVTAKRSADYTVGLKLGVTADEQFVVLDVYRAQKEFPDVQEAIVQNAAIDGTGTLIRLEAEKAGIIGLQYLMRDARMRPYAVDIVPPEGDKYTRALPAAARVEAGRVGVVRGDWNRAFLDELATFPAAAHDDQVDALSGAYTMLADSGPLILFEA